MFHNKDSADEFLHYLNSCQSNIKITIEFGHVLKPGTMKRNGRNETTETTETGETTETSETSETTETSKIIRKWIKKLKNYSLDICHVTMAAWSRT